jgi:2-phospho-L-lactate transferase/gluconeogenesis factor (CofD/UPF0052 family)
MAAVPVASLMPMLLLPELAEPVLNNQPVLSQCSAEPALTPRDRNSEVDRPAADVGECGSL